MTCEQQPHGRMHRCRRAPTQRVQSSVLFAVGDAAYMFGLRPVQATTAVSMAVSDQNTVYYSSCSPAL